jgi:flagellar protein FlgJ
MRAAIDPSGQFALDANALANLKQQAKSAPGEALGKAAGQFEALFLQMLMKQMRDALPQDGPLSSDATRSYTGMFDQQLAQQLSNHGVGLKKVIEKQLARHLAPAAGAEGGATAPQTSAPAKAKAIATATTTSPVAVRAVPTQAGTPTAGVLPAGVQAFVDKFRPYAEAVGKAMGVPANYLLAQAGLETGWGKSLARTSEGAVSHNLFGIKAGGAWRGGVAPAATTEYVDGKATRSTERFRSYASYGDAFQDFARLLRGSPRYAAALAKADDPKAYAAELQRAGYATDPFYGAKLARAIATVARHDAAAAPSIGQAPSAVPGIQVRASAADNHSKPA